MKVEPAPNLDLSGKDLLGRRTGHTFGLPGEPDCLTRREYWAAEYHRVLHLWETAFLSYGPRSMKTHAAAANVERVRDVLHEIAGARTEASRRRRTGRVSRQASRPPRPVSGEPAA